MHERYDRTRVGQPACQGQEDGRWGRGDVLATVYHVPGMDRRLAVADASGRPIPPQGEGQVIREVF